jgi:tetratricopeptide (TPR) repeat protein
MVAINNKILTSLFLLCAVSLSAAAPSAPKIEIAFQAYGERTITLANDFPVYFNLTLINPDARRISSQNCENRLNRDVRRAALSDQMSANDWKLVQKYYPTQNIPIYNLKDAPQILGHQTYLEFQGQKTFKPVIKFLGKIPSNLEIKEDSERFHVGIEIAELEKIPLGEYQVKIVIPKIGESKPMKITLVDTKSLTDSHKKQLQYETGRYLLLAGNPQEVLDKTAPEFQKQYPNSPLGWELEGDAHFALTHYQESIKAFEIALQKTQGSWIDRILGRMPQEPPEYYILRLNEAHKHLQKKPL